MKTKDGITTLLIVFLSVKLIDFNHLEVLDYLILLLLLCYIIISVFLIIKKKKD